MNNSKAYLILFLGVLGVSTSGIFVRLSEAPALVTAFYRLLFTLVLVLIINLFRKRDIKKAAPLSRYHLLLILLAGMFFAFHLWSWFLSLEYTSVANSTVIVNTQTVFVFLFSVLFWKEKIRFGALLSLLAALVGVIILSQGGFSASLTSIKGDLLALLGALMVAGYYICGKILRQELDTFSYTLRAYSFSTLILFLAILFQKIPLFRYSLKDYAIFGALALFCTILGHMLLNYSLRTLSAATVSLSILGEPVIASLIALFLFGETISPPQILGGFLVICGIVFFTRESKNLS